MNRRAFVCRSGLGIGLLAMGAASRPALSQSPSTPSRAFRSSEETASQRGGPGMLLSFLARSTDTGGALALLEGRGRPGMEPARHVHSREDETVHVLDGMFRFEAGGEEFDVGPGQTIFLPRNVPHGFEILSEEMHVLLLLTPGGLDEWFWNVTAPISEPGLIPPPPAGPPPVELIEEMSRALAEYGVNPA